MIILLNALNTFIHLTQCFPMKFENIKFAKMASDSSTSESPIYFLSPQYFKSSVYNILSGISQLDRKFFEPFFLKNENLKTLDFYLDKSKKISIFDLFPNNSENSRFFKYLNGEDIKKELVNELSSNLPSLKKYEEFIQKVATRNSEDLSKGVKAITIDWKEPESGDHFAMMTKVLSMFDDIITNRVQRIIGEDLKENMRNIEPNQFYTLQFKESHTQKGESAGSNSRNGKREVKLLPSNFLETFVKKIHNIRLSGKSISIITIMQPICEHISGFYKFDSDCSPIDIYCKLVFLMKTVESFNSLIKKDKINQDYLMTSYYQSFDKLLYDEYSAFMSIFRNQFELVVSQYLHSKWLAKDDLKKFKEIKNQFKLTVLSFKTLSRLITLFCNYSKILLDKPLEVLNLNYDELYKNIKVQFSQKIQEPIVDNVKDANCSLNTLDHELKNLEEDFSSVDEFEIVKKEENEFVFIIDENYFKIVNIDKLEFQIVPYGKYLNILRSSILELLYFPFKLNFKQSEKKRVLNP